MVAHLEGRRWEDDGDVPGDGDIGVGLRRQGAQVPADGVVAGVVDAAVGGGHERHPGRQGVGEAGVVDRLGAPGGQRDADPVGEGLAELGDLPRRQALAHLPARGAVAVTVTGLEVTDGALAAEIVPWLVAVVPGGVPGGNFTDDADLGDRAGQHRVEHRERRRAGGRVVVERRGLAAELTSAAAVASDAGSTSTILAPVQGSLSDEHEALRK